MKRARLLKKILIVLAISYLAILIKDEVKKINYEDKSINDFYLVDETYNHKIKYTLFHVESMQSYYLVLPSMYSSKKEMSFSVYYNDKKYKVSIDDSIYYAGDVWKGVQAEAIHTLKIQDVLGRICLEKPLQVLVSEDIPAMMVTVDTKEALFIDKKDTNKKYVERGNVLLCDENGEVEVETKLEKIVVRGNTSADLPKKPFRIVFKEPVSLCGMEASKEWNLLANAKDGSHIRNKILLDWAKELGNDYNVNCEFLELFVNGEYQGLYLATETITNDKLGIDVDNSIFAEMELYYRAVEEDYYLATERQHHWVIQSEKYVSKEKMRQIEEHFNEIESALYSEDGRGENTGKYLHELLDYDSWTDAWLLEEIGSDVDLGTTSQFAYMEDWEGRSILKAGPEWDFDVTFGNTNLEVFKNPRNLVVAIPNTKGIKCISQNVWLSSMYKNDEFREMLIDKFEVEIRPKINRLLEYEINDYVENIRRASLLDSLRWRQVEGVYSRIEVEAANPAKDYKKFDYIDSEVEYLKQFLSEKEKFLVELWIEGAEFDVLIEERNGLGMNLELNNDIYTWIRKDKGEEK